MEKEDFTIFVDKFAEVVANKVIEKLNLAHYVTFADQRSQENEYLTVQDVCRQFRISKATFYRHRDLGFITPSMYVGRKPLFTRRAIEDYLKAFNSDDSFSTNRVR